MSEKTLIINLVTFNVNFYSFIAYITIITTLFFGEGCFSVQRYVIMPAHNSMARRFGKSDKGILMETITVEDSVKDTGRRSLQVSVVDNAKMDILACKILGEEMTLKDHYRRINSYEKWLDGDMEAKMPAFAFDLPPL